MSWKRIRRSPLKPIEEKKKIPEIAEEVIDASDIILEILDARFLEETRNNVFEERIIEKGKKIIYIINKIDLVNTAELKKNPKMRDLVPYVFISALKRFGINDLRKKIKIEVKKMKLENRAVIGIVGYPNTGKSSLINLLSGKTSAKVSKEAGFTKGKQKISLTKNIVLIDTPGVIPNSFYSNVEPKSLARQIEVGARGYDNIRSPEDVIDFLMKKYPNLFEEYFKINADGDAEMLLELLGRKKKFLKKGNTVNTDRTARFILKEWQEGKITKFIKR